MTLQCLVIDDEPLARKGLAEYIDDVDFLELVAAVDSPLKATDLLQSGKAQLLFLDIQMPKLNGLQFFRSLPQPPPVVFTTAYPQYALDGFELNALDYLVKPVSFDRFLKAALKAKEYYELREQNKGGTAVKDYLFIKADGKLLKIFYDDILYVEAVENYVSIHTTVRKYLTYLTFHAVEEFLPAERFVKTHKSYLVSIDQIKGFEGNVVNVAGHQLPVSRLLKDAVFQKVVGGRSPKR